MRAKKTSLSDIASRLGVSKTLVSLVLNGKARENRISAELIEKVLEVASELNYKPNHLARSLRLGRSNTLGLIVADISNSFFGRIGRVIEDEAEKHGYTLIFCSCDEDKERLGRQINVLADKQVDGLIIAPTEGSAPFIKELLDQNYPVVLIDRYFEELECPVVMLDNRKAAYDTVSYLLAQGYKNIAYVNYRLNLMHFKDRQQGYAEALNDHGLTYRSSMVKGVDFDELESSMKGAIDELFTQSEKPDAIFFANGRVGIEGLQVLFSRKIRIPEELAIVSFDDNETFGLSYVPVSCLAQPVDELGRRAFEMLQGIIEKTKEPSAPQVCHLQGELILRESSQVLKQ
ncbi:MAG: LacI family DNA-binding transcriptional regulator [Cyclobacteriaceae bacterium]|nr:LacI family DNA-binding transcriptional regulator [Cyclobacteriaceae bacterium]